MNEQSKLPVGYTPEVWTTQHRSLTGVWIVVLLSVKQLWSNTLSLTLGVRVFVFEGCKG